ncbi:phosphoglycolate/pyridoxal phosphate family phosphatase [bacterium]|nr:phosphoglycolate/pyridoxal phosphate family phosphatase [bacterium]
MKLLIFDMDGVIYRGNSPLPGAKETLEALRRQGKFIAFLTNNSTMTRFQYRRKLAHMGIKASVKEIFTSAWGTALFLKEKNLKRAFVIGEEGLKKELRWAGIEVVSLPDIDVDCVVVGLDRKFTYKKLCYAFKAVRKGAQFIATNKDWTFPLENEIVPGGGAIVSALQFALNQEPILIGKPSLFLLELVIKHFKVSKGETVIVGDRLDTDIEMGLRAGIKTVLVLTGVTTEEELSNSTFKPDAIVKNIGELLQIEWLK